MKPKAKQPTIGRFNDPRGIVLRKDGKIVADGDYPELDEADRKDARAKRKQRAEKQRQQR